MIKQLTKQQILLKESIMEMILKHHIDDVDLIIVCAWILNKVKGVDKK